jgi:signal peptidase II
MLRRVLLIIFSVLAIDQIIKIWIKLTMSYGQSSTLINGWFELQFVENPGMAFGWMLPGQEGKLALSIFRVIVAVGIGYYLHRIIAGALGNILDSLAYGLIFDKGCLYDPEFKDYLPYHGVAALSSNGYAAFLMGNVVDMFHFSKEVHFPEWFPFWGGETKEIFPPVFNVADSSITAGILSIIIWQRRFFDKKEEAPAP